MTRKNRNIVFYALTVSDIVPPLGIGYLVTSLRTHNFDCDIQYIENAKDNEKAVEEICNLKPSVIGLTSVSMHFKQIKDLCEKLKSACDAIILLGGPHITSVPETLPPEVDVGFLGEAEETIIDVFNLIENNSFNSDSLRKIPGIVFYDEGNNLNIIDDRRPPKNIDLCAPPARDIFPEYYWKRDVAVMLTSRGCPYKCSFCQVVAVTKLCRYNSPQKIVAEIQELYTKYGMKNISIADDLFVVNKKRVKQLIEELKNSGLHGKLTFCVNGRANVMTEELVGLLAEMGTTEITLGLESMSQRVLSLLKDNVTVEDNINAIEIINRAGIKTGGLYMIGTPTETIEELDVTYRFLKENRHKFAGVEVCITTPLPKTKMWDICLERGLIDSDVHSFKWDKLALAVDDFNANLYVGDINHRFFSHIHQLFRRLAHQPDLPLPDSILISEEKIKDNFIKPAINDFMQVRGSYLPEKWEQGDVFWTNGLTGTEIYLKPSGNESKIVLDYFTGQKEGGNGNYKVEIKLLDFQDETVLLESELEAPKASWRKDCLDLPPLHTVKMLKLIINSDYFCPKKSGQSEDPRNLGIAIRDISLVSDEKQGFIANLLSYFKCRCK